MTNIPATQNNIFNGRVFPTAALAEQARQNAIIIEAVTKECGDKELAEELVYSAIDSGAEDVLNTALSNYKTGNYYAF